jgi:WD40 repeat protein
MTHKHAVAVLTVVAALFGQFGSAHAQQAALPNLPAEPILRIEAGEHSARILRIDTDAANKFVVTTSYDKTARVWSLPNGKLDRVLRLPIDYGNIGKAYSVAISPDGNTIAVGGWTGPVPHHNIFLFDRASGAMKQRLGDLPDVINHLAYSTDGKRLAASLSNYGIRVFDAVNSYRLLPSDAQYGGDSYSAMFDRAGRLVTSSQDGVIRLYGADQYAAPAFRFEWKGHRPYTAAFSPDGSRVAVGASENHDVVVLSGSNLKELFKPDTTRIPKNDALDAVAWSEDGRFLYAGGSWNPNNVWQVRGWSDGGRGRYVDVPVASQIILELIALKSGSILVGGAKGVALLDPDAKVRQLQGFGALDLSSDVARSMVLQVSADGGIVQIDAREPRHTYRFAIADRLVKIDPPKDDALKSPITNGPGLDIKNWVESYSAAVNGSPIKLQANERSLSVAIVPSTKHFVLGADFSLRLLNQLGHDVWPRAPGVPDGAWHVNVTGNQRLVVAAYGDGTIRWHRLSDGKQLLALFIHPDGQRWVVWTPEGYYDASVGADELIGWHINHGYDRVPDFYPVLQFRDRFYRPDVIRRLLQTPNLDVEQALRDADQAAGRRTTGAVSVRSLLTPMVEINDPKNPAAVDRTDLTIGYSVRSPSPSDTLRVEALVDAVNVTAEDRRLVDVGETRAGILHLTIPRRDSTVSVLAYNQNGAGEPAKVQVKWRGPGTDPKATLYVLAIGISNYKDQNIRLRYPAKDATDFVALAKAQEGGL